METGLSELRDSCKPLALATAFEPPKTQYKLACIWLFALELDKAILLPKEEMLRLIRLQWWQDALDSGRDQNVPLVRDLLQLIASGDLDKAWLFSLVEQWQSVSEDPSRLSTCWEMLLQTLGGSTSDEVAALGHNLFCVLQRRPDKCEVADHRLKLTSVKQAAMLRACRYLVKRGQSVDLFDDGTLGFRLFGHMLFGGRNS